MNVSAAFVGLAFLIGGSIAVAQDDMAESAEGRRHCISLSRVDRSEVIDDRHIAFHMKGRDQVYLNTLRRRCPGMRRNDILMFRTMTNQVCNIDMVTVLDDIGFGFSPGVSCGLGEFALVTEEQLETLRERAKMAREAEEPEGR